MKAMKNILKYIPALLPFFCILSLTGCSTDHLAEDVPETDSAGEFIIYASDYVADWTESPETKSLTALQDALQKQIHNLYYFFYDREGYLEKIFYQDVEPTMSIKVSRNSFLDENNQPVTPHGVVFVIANSERMNVAGSNDGLPKLVSSKDVSVGDINAWKQNVATVNDFKKKGLFPLFIEHAVKGVQGGNKKVGRPDHVIMLGYFDGTLDDDSIQIPLGRLVARLRVNLSGAGLGVQARITINNAALYTSVFPEVEGGAMPKPSDDPNGQFWGTFTETIDNAGYYGGITGTGADAVANLYYYCGENDVDYTETPTVLKIEAWDQATPLDADGERTGTPDRTYQINLGQQSPYVSGRNLSLYRNTSYTFNLELNK